MALTSYLQNRINTLCNDLNLKDFLNKKTGELSSGQKNRVSLSETEIEKMINLRDIARENKDYKEADRIRDELSDKGVLIEDKDGKTLWKFK